MMKGPTRFMLATLAVFAVVMVVIAFKDDRRFFVVQHKQSPELQTKLEAVNANLAAVEAARGQAQRGRLSVRHSSYFDEDHRVAIRASTEDGTSIHNHDGMELGAAVLAHAQEACAKRGQRVLMSGHGVDKRGIRDGGTQTGWMYLIPCAR